MSLTKEGMYKQTFKTIPTTPTKNTPKILDVLWELKKAGKAKATIKNIGKCLKVLDKHSNLNNPDNILTFVATANKKNGYKRNLIMAYQHYVNRNGLTWKKPKYHQNAKMPKIPQEQKINLIMTKAPLKLRTAIGISKDTGLRPVDLMRVTLRDIYLAN